MKYDRYYRLWADVDLDAVRENIARLKNHLNPEVKACAVIKADAYGHGAVQTAAGIRDLVDFYAVATIDEAMELRASGIEKPVLVLGFVHASMYETAIRHQIRLTVYDLETAGAISQAAKKTGQTAKVHVKIDTGMSRLGFVPGEEACRDIDQMHGMEGLLLEGIYTHFANADAKTPDHAKLQLHRFLDFCILLKAHGISIPIRHCSNSAAATCLREADLDMVRLGISMYGLYPSEHVHQIPLLPALSLKSHVIMVKTVPAGTSVGYGSTWTAQKESRIATIPVGYADGYHRSLSNKGVVLIHGHRFPVVGRVCMDQLMADVTGFDVQKNDEVVLIGTSGFETITMEEIAALAGTFNYEFVCGLSRRVPQKYYRGGQLIGVNDVFAACYPN